MSTAWIQVFILTFAECVAPAGKTVCQEQQFELQFLSRDDCEYALQQLIAAKDGLENVIVNRQKSRCVPSAVESEVYESLESISNTHQGEPGWRKPDETDLRRQRVNQDHEERLKSLMPCEDTSYVAPCKVGNIIVEDATGNSVEVWKRD